MTKISCLFLICSTLSLDARREHSPKTRSSLATETKLDTVNANLTIVAAALAAIASNTSTTAINTAGNGGSVASVVVLKNLSGANHAGVGANWSHPLDITPATAGNLFKFSENIVFSTVANITAESAAIVVGKDNVTIDLAGQTLSTTITGNFVHGIFIKPGIKGTQIISSTQNVNNKGIIQDFKGYGIYIAGTGGSTVKNTSIDNVSCAYNSKGLHAEHADDISITNSAFIANTSPSVNAYGIYMQNIKNALISNVKANANNSVPTAYGIYFENTTNSTIENSSADLNHSTGTAGVRSAYGIFITSSAGATSSSNKIISCTANENYFSGVGTNQEAVGIMLTTNGGTTTSNIIANCTTQRNVFTAVGATNPVGYGIKIASAVNNEIRGCTSSYNATVGIIDTAVNSSTNTYHSNTCTKNGPGGLANYSVSFITEPLKVLRVQFRDYMGIHNALSKYANIETVD